MDLLIAVGVIIVMTLACYLWNIIEYRIWLRKQKKEVRNGMKEWEEKVKRITKHKYDRFFT